MTSRNLKSLQVGLGWAMLGVRFRPDMSVNSSSIPPDPQPRWRRLRQSVLRPAADTAELKRALAAASQRLDPPLLWLLGPTQAGKTAIVQALTGSTRAEIGSGFRPCTRHARIYDFPESVPVVRFLDTRGLGEVDYDPADDLVTCERQAHQLIVVARVADTRPEPLLKALTAVRRRHPDWPIVFAQTCLHERYPEPSDSHTRPYPFDQLGWTERVPPELVRAIQAQRQALADLPGNAPVYWVPIDFTQAQDGFEPVDYGLESLWTALETAAGLGLEQRLATNPEISSAFTRASHPQIVGYSLATAAVGAVPLVDLAAVPALQARLLQVLAAIYGQPWQRRTVAEFFGLLGGGFAIGYGLRAAGRSLAKLIPGWGQTAGALWAAGSSAAVTFALGKTAELYLLKRARGQAVDAAELRAAWSQALAEGRGLVKKMGHEQS